MAHLFRRRLLLPVAVALLAGSGGILAGVWQTSRGTAQDESHPAPDAVIVDGSNDASAIAGASQRSQVEARTLDALPRDATLWVVAAEYGPQGRSGPREFNSVVLDYYAGPRAKSPGELMAYAGLRISAAFWAQHREPPADARPVPGLTGVFVASSQVPDHPMDVYYVVHADQTVEVRVWTTGSGGIPDADEMHAALGSLAE